MKVSECLRVLASLTLAGRIKQCMQDDGPGPMCMVKLVKVFPPTGLDFASVHIHMEYVGWRDNVNMIEN